MIVAGAPELEGLLEVLAAAPPASGVPLIVVDGIIAGTRAAADAAVLARTARRPPHALLQPADRRPAGCRPSSAARSRPAPADRRADRPVPRQLAARDPAIAAVTVPPLTAAQIGQYLDSWLHATQPSRRSPCHR